jgi:hypothetical protein
MLRIMMIGLRFSWALLIFAALLLVRFPNWIFAVVSVAIVITTSAVSGWFIRRAAHRVERKNLAAMEDAKFTSFRSE